MKARHLIPLGIFLLLTILLGVGLTLVVLIFYAIVLG